MDFAVPKMESEFAKRRWNKGSSHVINEVRTSLDEDASLAAEDGDEFVYDNWEERDDDVTDVVLRSAEDQNHNEPGDECNGGIKRTKKNSQVTTSCGERTYPIDMWFILGNFIYPESVKIFGCLCKDSYIVLRTFKFWSNLYHRTLKNSEIDKGEKLSRDLQVSKVIRPLSVRAHVIKGLYKFHPPFQNHLLKQKLDSVDPDFLIGYKCVSYWATQSGKGISPRKEFWNFYFKLQEPNLTLGTNDRLSLFNEMSEAVSFNPHEGSIVVHAVSDNYIPLQSPMGLYLGNVSYNSSRDMRHMRLKLQFRACAGRYISSSLSHGRNSTSDAMEVRILDPVCSLRILNWWHPDYPTTDNLSSLQDTTDVYEEWDT